MIKIWEEILHTAIIGTEKKQVNTAVLPEEFISMVGQLKLRGDKESQFLALTSLVRGYRKGSFQVSKASVPNLPPCPAEHKSYINSQTLASLQAVLGEENNSLLFWWLLFCTKNNLVVNPEYIPTLMKIAEINTELRDMILACCGKRGEWLATFNSKWNFSKQESISDQFDRGRPEERKKAFTLWRLIAADEAREALIKTWKEEQAATKADFLALLENNLNTADESFLKDVLKEKSQKVKDVALKLLKQLPTSFVVKEIWDFVSPLVTIKKESSMLGLVSKESIHINLSFEIPLQFRSYGISHIDANKLYSEKEFTMSQMMGMIPLFFWEHHFQMKAAQILDLFHKKTNTEKFISSFASAANTFKNVEWALILYTKYKKLCLDVVDQFERPLQEEVALEVWGNQTLDFYTLLPGKEKEWSEQFVLSLLLKTSQDPYRYGRNFYKNIVHHIPVSILSKLDALEQPDFTKKDYHDSIISDLKKMLSIKHLINQSF
ncbi:hypothetical protein CNR22_13145 [Sphingobacteriaceae bacterium]|nr:hypothetical protein CNR22_13145 [Sphingobacteriaceae bacterium]